MRTLKILKTLKKLSNITRDIAQFMWFYIYKNYGSTATTVISTSTSGA